MVALTNFAVHIPNTFADVMSISNETRLPKSMLSLFKKIYGLKQIAISSESIDTMIDTMIDHFIKNNVSIQNINYIFFPHTAAWVSPYGHYLLSSIKKKYNLHSAHTVGTTLQKCVSFFKVLELLQIIFSVNPNDTALILTAEKAFTPQLRVVPRSSLVSDVATLSLWRSNGSHQLKSILNRFVRGYSKGIYLSNDESIKFDTQFIGLLSSIILDAIHQANLSLSDITLILPHNVNLPTWQKMATFLSISIDKIYSDNIPRYAHSFCSDHLVNLGSAICDARLKKGDYYVMAGCGLGFYLSAAVFQY